MSGAELAELAEAVDATADEHVLVDEMFDAACARNGWAPELVREGRESAHKAVAALSPPDRREFARKMIDLVADERTRP